MKKIFLFLLASATMGLSSLNSNAQTWSSPGTDIAFAAKCFVVYNDELYAGFNCVGEHHGVLKLAGPKWENVGSGVLPSSAYVNSLVVYKGELYAGGWFTNAGNKTVKSIARWNGKEWNDVGGGIIGFDQKVNTMAVYKDELYVGGSFKNAGGKLTYCIAKWNGKTWSTVGTGLTGPPKELIVYKDELYAAGDLISTVGPSKSVTTRLNNLGKWDGTKWSPVGPLGKATLDVNYTFSIYKDELYVSGYVGEINGKTDHTIAKWDGTQWSNVGKGLHGRIYSSIVHNDELYVGGDLSVEGNKTEKFIAKWNGTEWSSLKGSVDDDVHTLFSFNNELWVTGIFYEAGGQKIKNMAKYKE